MGVRVEGVTTSSNISGTTPRPNVPMGGPDREIPQSTVTMWTGKLMDAPGGKKVPCFVEVPLAAHIDSGETPRKCINEKGFRLIKDSPKEVQDYYNKISKVKPEPTWDDLKKQLAPYEEKRNKNADSKGVESNQPPKQPKQSKQTKQTKK